MKSIILFLLFIGIAVAAQQSYIEYTPTSYTECDSGTCTLSLFSGITYVEEDGYWKHISNARSLKGKGFNWKVTKDNPTDVDVVVLDFNYTTINYKINKTPKTKILIRIYAINDTGQKELIFEKNIKLKKLNKTLDKIEKKADDASIFGYEIHFGENSTVLTLQNNISENLDDTYTISNVPTTTAGSNTAAHAGTSFSDGTYYAHFKFNISAIPVGVTNLDATFKGYRSETLETGETLVLSAEEITCSWEEATLDYSTWSTSCRSSPAVSDSTVTVTDDGLNKWESWNITTIVKKDYDASSNSTDFTILYDSCSGGCGNSDDISIRTKESGVDITKRPILNITYNEAAVDPDTTSPTWENASNTSIGTSSAIIRCDSNESANFTVWYGTTTSFGSSISNTTSLTGTHQVKLTSLTNNTLYYWIGGGCDADANCANISSTINFTTTQNPPPAANSCTCTDGQSWSVNLSHYCILNTDCNTLPYTVTFVGTGTLRINATLKTNRTIFTNLPDNQKIVGIPSSTGTETRLVY